jgi:hypothetical protein
VEKNIAIIISEFDKSIDFNERKTGTVNKTRSTLGENIF